MYKNLLTRLALVSVLILSGGCVTKTEYVSVPLPVPERPEYVFIAEEELKCLSEDTFEKLVKQDAIWEAHVDRLENIIRQTHNQ